MIYLGYRSQSLLMFRWGEKLGLSSILDSWRNWCSLYPMPTWIINALPDGLWLLSYMLLMDLIWRGYSNQYQKWLYVLPIIAIISELSQLWISHIGTYDIVDVGCYLGAILLFEIKTRIKWKRKKH